MTCAFHTPSPTYETFYSWKHVRILGTRSIFYVENVKAPFRIQSKVINEPFAKTQLHYLYERVGLFLQLYSYYTCMYLGLLIMSNTACFPRKPGLPIPPFFQQLKLFRAIHGTLLIYQHQIIRDTIKDQNFVFHLKQHNFPDPILDLLKFIILLLQSDNIKIRMFLIQKNIHKEA